MSERNAGPSPEGVMHGPYPKTEKHPHDQIIGHSEAVEDAYWTEQITNEQREALHRNLDSVATGANDEELFNEAVNKDHEEALEENEARDKVAPYIAEHGKPQNYDYYIKNGDGPVEALNSALKDDAHQTDMAELYYEEDKYLSGEDLEEYNHGKNNGMYPG